MAKTLIAFFSRAGENYFGGALKKISVGNTETAVRKLQELIRADVFKIEMASPYSEDYMTCIKEAKEDLSRGARPEIKNAPDNIDGYDTVVIAYPNYWGTMPAAVFTFIDRYDFSGKTILPLCTNEGGGLGQSERDIKRLCPGATVLKGLSITGSRAAASKPLIEKWLRDSIKPTR